MLSEYNPVHMISHGLDAKDIFSCDLWWNGPKLLQKETQPVENCLELSDNSVFKKELQQMPGCNLLIFESNVFLDEVLNRANN